MFSLNLSSCYCFSLSFALIIYFLSLICSYFISELAFKTYRYFWVDPWTGREYLNCWPWVCFWARFYLSEGFLILREKLRVHLSIKLRYWVLFGWLWTWYMVSLILNYNEVIIEIWIFMQLIYFHYVFYLPLSLLLIH